MSLTDDFKAGISVMIIIVFIWTAIFSVTPVSIWSVIDSLIMIVIFADCVIDLYNYWNRRKKSHTIAQVEIKDIATVESFIKFLIQHNLKVDTQKPTEPKAKVRGSEIVMPNNPSVKPSLEGRPHPAPRSGRKVERV